MILCNPHNPVGRVWTRAESARVADICERHQVFVISDEIHGDFVFPPHRYQMNKINIFTSLATEAASTEGGAWLDALLAYLQNYVALIRDYLQASELKVSLIEPEGTFLAWLDFRGLGLEAKALEQFLAQEAGLALSPGYWFGREGAGFARMTIGCPRATVERALENLAVAVKGLG